jgi:hypothetical protein
MVFTKTTKSSQKQKCLIQKKSCSSFLRAASTAATGGAGFIGARRFELMRHGVCFSLSVEVSEIYNLACPASPIHYQFDPVQTTKTSVHGAIDMLGLAKRVKAKILQASTSEIYGDPNVPAKRRLLGNVNPIGPRSCMTTASAQQTYCR